MNRSSKGFGLAGVLATVILLIVAAMFSASAKSQTLDYCLQSSVGCIFT
jgi:hypothetical protein